MSQRRISIGSNEYVFNNIKEFYLHSIYFLKEKEKKVIPAPYKPVGARRFMISVDGKHEDGASKDKEKRFHEIHDGLYIWTKYEWDQAIGNMEKLFLHVNSGVKIIDHGDVVTKKAA
jgi:hypothetical protein